MVFKKLKAKEFSAKRAPLTADIGVETIGNQELLPIVKKDYGFD
jgi:hypothetical protein